MGGLSTMRVVAVATVVMVTLAGAARANLLVNGDFEASPFDTGWYNTVATAETTSPISGSATARMGFNTTGDLEQNFTPVSDFVVNFSFRQIGNTAGRTLNVLLNTDATYGNVSANVNLRIIVASSEPASTRWALQTFDGANWVNVVNPDVFKFDSLDPYRFEIRGHGWGGATPTYDVLWSDANSTSLTHSATGLTLYQSTPASTMKRVRFTRPFASGNSWLVDDVSVTATAVPTPAALRAGLVLMVATLARRRTM